MNLKDAFRYQNFISQMLREAMVSIENYNHCLKCERKHFRMPVEADVTEAVDRGSFPNNDNVISFINFMLNEKEKLSDKIFEAKGSIGFDIDGAMATNKCRQTIVSSLRSMMRNRPERTTGRESGFKINNEGNQTPYYYTVESVYSYDYDIRSAKERCKSMAKESDAISSKIDSAMVNTVVDYDPPFEVGISFEDAVNDFVISQIPF